MKKIIAVSFIVMLFLLPSCGRKGDPIIPGTVLPQAPSGLEAETRPSGIILYFTMPDKNSAGRLITDLAGFRVLRAELPAGQDACPCSFKPIAYIDLEYPASQGAAVTERRVAWLDPAAGLVLGVRYVYKVVGVNEDEYIGQESAPVTVHFQALPAAMAGLTARPGNRRVFLNWQPVEKDVLGGPLGDLVGYNVYRTLDPKEFPVRPLNPKPITGASYEDAGLSNGAVYYYRMTTLRGSEAPYAEGEPSPAASAAPFDAEPPAAPAGLRAAPGEGFALLSWEPNMEDDLAGYYVYRKGPGGADFKRLNEKPTDRITYKDEGLAPGSEYTYAVAAVDNAVPPNEGKRSSSVVVKMP